MKLNIIIGIEIFYPQINGVVTTTMNLAQNFKALGHNPLIVTPRVVKNSPDVQDGIPVRYIPSTDALTYPGLRLVNTKSSIFKEIVETHNTNIIQTTAPWFLCKGFHRVAKRKHIPIVNTFHTNLHDPGYIQYIAPIIMNRYTVKHFQKAVWNASRPFLNPCDILVAPSPATCNDLEKQYPKKRVEWIPNGVSTEAFESENPGLLKTILPIIIQENLKYAIFVGRLAKEKSVNELIHAVKIVKETIPEFRLIIVGDGPKRKEYEHLVKKLDVSTHIRFLGKIDNQILITSGLIKKAHFFTTASTTETHSMTVTEALCCGTPVVVSDHLSMTYFTHDVACYFRPHDPESIAKAMIKMWNDDKFYQKLKENAKNMLKQFDGEAIAKQYLELYYELLSSKKFSP